MIYNENRTAAYRMTISMKDGAPSTDADRQGLEVLRRTVSGLNKLDGGKRYVKLFGRGHRMGNWRYNQSLPLQYATSADVYVYERS
jgi:hypothetical protein